MLGYKSCGYLDTLYHVMCILQSESCPINKIKISDDDTMSDATLPHFSIQLENGNYLHYTNQATDDYVVSRFRLSDEQVYA